MTNMKDKTKPEIAKKVPRSLGAATGAPKPTVVIAIFAYVIEHPVPDWECSLSLS